MSYSETYMILVVRMERTVYNILRTRDSLIRHFKEFLIPTDWMLDVGILSKVFTLLYILTTDNFDEGSHKIIHETGS